MVKRLIILLTAFLMACSAPKTCCSQTFGKEEVKDLVVKGNKGKRGPADAQTGNVPMPQFKALVKEYTGEDYDYNIPDYHC